MQILVTGGAGYIGSHACISLLKAGHQVVVVDNLCNSTRQAITLVEQITQQKLSFYEQDLRDKKALTAIFKQHPFDAVMHFAGLKSVDESIAQPLAYYDANVNSTITLCEVMQLAGVFQIVFSSSATVYGYAEALPITEQQAIQPINPYGRSKYMIEMLLQDCCQADPRWSVAILRYFNPIGADPSGLIGEVPRGVPNNIMPYMLDVAAGKLPRLNIFGNDYPTCDGTGVRDYIHVVDLVEGHLKALDYLQQHQGCMTCNLGTGQGYSVMQLIQTFEASTKVKIPYQITARRTGDVAECYADASLAREKLDWQCQYDLATMCVDAWRWRHGVGN